MSNVNEILPFALEPGANVLAQDLYDELAARTAGFPKGLLPSAQINKALRQSAFVSSVLAQLISDTLAQDVPDNGDTAALQAQLTATIAALASVDAPVQTVAGRVGHVVLAALDISDSGAAGRQVLQAATAAAIKAILAISFSDVSGLGSAAQQASSAFDAAGSAAAVQALAALKANNLSDLPSPSTARTSLGLGTAATHATGDFDTAGAAAAAQAAATAANRSVPVSDGAANRDLVLADVWVHYMRMTRGTANTVTLDGAVLATMANGDEISGIQAGAGQTTLTFTGGITPLATPGLKTRAQGSPWTIKRVDATHVDVFGDLSA